MDSDDVGIVEQQQQQSSEEESSDEEMVRDLYCHYVYGAIGCCIRTYITCCLVVNCRYLRPMSAQRVLKERALNISLTRIIWRYVVQAVCGCLILIA